MVPIYTEKDPYIRDVQTYQKKTYIYEDRQADFERRMHLYDDASY